MRFENLVTTEFVQAAAYGESHRVPFFQPCFETLLIPIDPDLKAATLPLNTEGQGAPIYWQLWIDGNAVASQR